jgi:anti-sigma factor RsiW
MHLDEEQLRRLLDGELSRPAETAAREHLASCEKCRAGLAEAENADAELRALLREVDHPPPKVDVLSLVRRAEAHDVRWPRWAAAILVALGLASAAYAMPGSPLPAVARAIAAWLKGGRTGPPEAPALVAAPTADVAGIAITPGRQLVILFTTVQDVGQAEISLTGDSQVVVRAPSGAATFTTEEDRLLIDNRGSTATFQVQVPQAAPRVEIRVAGDRRFLKEGARVTTENATEAGGLYSLPLTPSQP